MSTAIIGWTGFVGQTLTVDLPSADLYNSSNISSLKNKWYDTIYFCALPAEKWRINQNPTPDYENTISLIELLKTVTVRRFILISTVDVLDCTKKQDENGTAYAYHPYGKHRLLMENFVRDFYPVHHILRLPGLFGKGLKKNIIYDLLHNNQVSNICLESAFQWYNLSNLVHDISYCIMQDIKLAHLVSPPITVRDIVTKFFPNRIGDLKGINTVTYQLITNTNNIGYWNNEENIIYDIERYIHYEQALQHLPVALSVSNIAWDHSLLGDIQKVLTRYRIQSLELAPTKIAAWDAWTPDIIQGLRSMPIRFTSCQSILYNTPIHIFEHTDAFIDHYTQVTQICQQLNIPVIIFGSPKARHLGDWTEHDAVTLFRNIGDIGERAGVTCCIEPNATAYGCTWLTDLSSTVAFIKHVDHPFVRCNYDLGNYSMENDTYEWSQLTLPMIGHVQVSNAFLRPLNELDSAEIAIYKKQLQNILQLGYNKSISLEMASTSFNNIVKSIDIFTGLVVE